MTIAVLEQDREKAKELAQIYKLKMYELFSIMTAFFDENREFLNPKNQEEKAESITDLLEQKINKNLTKQINRLIGFIKKQDEQLLDIQQDVRKGTKQVLFKIIPLKDQEFAEYNPLFDDYDMVVLLLKKLLAKKGIKEEAIAPEIAKELGDHPSKNYRESNEKIQIKNFLDIKQTL